MSHETVMGRPVYMDGLALYLGVELQHTTEHMQVKQQLQS